MSEVRHEICDDCPLETALDLADAKIKATAGLHNRDTDRMMALGSLATSRGFLTDAAARIGCSGPDSGPNKYKICPLEGVVNDARGYTGGPNEQTKAVLAYNIFADKDDEKPPTNGLYI